MIQVKIKDRQLAAAASEGMDAFVDAVASAILDAVGGELNGEAMAQLNADQITLLAYMILRDEVMEGGFVQLIYNGYGAFIFKNPFARMLKEWGIVPLGQIISKAHKYFNKYRDVIERDLTDEEFHALFEQCPEFDDFDDEFVVSEEHFTQMVACYVDDNLDKFVTIEQD